MQTTEVCGRDVTAKDILGAVPHGYEIMDHDERDAMGDSEYDAITRAIRYLAVSAEDMPENLTEDGYLPEDVRFLCDSTDSGIDAKVDWQLTEANKDARTQG